MASSMEIKCSTVGLSWSASSLDVVIEVFCYAVFFHFFTRKFIVSLTLMSTLRLRQRYPKPVG